MKVYKYKYIADAYENILKDLLHSPEYISKPRGMEVREILNCVVEIENPNMNLFINDARSSPETYIASELLWYFSGTNNIDFISNYASMWKSLANENKEVNSAYGKLIFLDLNEHDYTQYQWVIESLKKDKDSRQAFMHFNKPEHQYSGNKDQVCTLNALFHIRDNKLNMTLTMRSNDVIFGFMTDYAFFNILHQHVYLHLKLYYAELIMGTYTHISHSMHLYERHYSLVQKMIDSVFIPFKTPILNTAILEEDGRIKEEYLDLFSKVTQNRLNEVKKYDLEETNNYILSWCISKINEEHKTN